MINNELKNSQLFVANVLGIIINFFFGYTYFVSTDYIYINIKNNYFFIFLPLFIIGWFVIALVTGYFSGRLAGHYWLFTGFFSNMPLIVMNSIGNFSNLFDIIFNFLVMIPIIIYIGTVGAQAGQKRYEKVLKKEQSYISTARISKFIIYISSLIISIDILFHIVYFFPNNIYFKGTLLSLISIALLFIVPVQLISIFSWVHKAFRNLNALNVSEVAFSPEWAVGYFFIPVINLYKPYQIFQELYKASEPLGDIGNNLSWKIIKPSPLIKWWWLLFIIYLFAITLFAFMFLKNTIFLMFVFGFEIVLTIIFLIIMKSISDMQDMKIKMLS